MTIEYVKKTQNHDPAVLQEIDMSPNKVTITNYQPIHQPAEHVDSPFQADVQPSSNPVVGSALARAYRDAQERYNRRRK